MPKTIYTNLTATGRTITAATFSGNLSGTINSITISGTASTTMTLPSTTATLARTDAAQTFTGTQTFSGAITATGGVTAAFGVLNGSSQLGTSSTSHIIREQATVVGTGFAGYSWNIGGTSNVVFITANSTANGTLALTWSGPSINTAFSIGETWTGTILLTNGATPFRITALSVDGTAQTIKWSQGVAPAAGSANSVDAYTFVLIKTASATYTVLGTFAKFA